MDIDSLVPKIEEARERGATVLLKWDGERLDRTCTVVLSYPPAEWFWRQDTDNLASSLVEGLGEFDSIFAAASAKPRQGS
jgi:hypothetical protein